MSGAGQGIFSVQAILISLAIHVVVVGGLFSFGNAGKETVPEEVRTETPRSAEVTPAPEPKNDIPPEPSVEKEAAEPRPEKPERASEKPGPVEIRIEPVGGSGPAVKPDAAPPAAAEKKDAVKTRVYTVKRGDTLTAIARDCGLTIPELAELNGKSVKKLSNLKIGQRLKLPAKD
jgi:LysM repeat protein